VRLKPAVVVCTHCARSSSQHAEALAAMRRALALCTLLLAALSAGHGAALEQSCTAVAYACAEQCAASERDLVAVPCPRTAICRRCASALPGRGSSARVGRQLVRAAFRSPLPQHA